MTCLGCKYARLCIMYEPRMKACKDYQSILGVKVDGLYGKATQAAAKAYRK